MKPVVVFVDAKPNGFVDEFRKAQGNLQANIAAGRGTTFAYTGAPGTSPLPTFAAFFDRVCDVIARDFLPGVTTETLYEEVSYIVGAAFMPKRIAA